MNLLSRLTGVDVFVLLACLAFAAIGVYILRLARKEQAGGLPLVAALFIVLGTGLAALVAVEGFAA